MNIREAAKALRAQLGRPEWLTSIGIGQFDGYEALVLYLKNGECPRHLLVDGFEGFPVVTRVFGEINPLNDNG